MCEPSTLPIHKLQELFPSKTYKNTFLIFEEKREHGSLFGHLRLFYGVFDDDDNDDYGEDDDNDDDWCT